MTYNRNQNKGTFRVNAIENNTEWFNFNPELHLFPNVLLILCLSTLTNESSKEELHQDDFPMSIITSTISPKQAQDVTDLNIVNLQGLKGGKKAQKEVRGL